MMRRLVVMALAMLWAGPVLAEPAAPAHAWGDHNHVLLVMHPPAAKIAIQLDMAATPGVYAQGSTPGGDPGAQVAGNLVGNLLAAKIIHFSAEGGQQERIQALAAICEKEDLLAWMTSGLEKALAADGVQPDVEPPGATAPDIFLQDAVHRGTGYDQAASIQPALHLDETLRSLATRYDVHVWPLPTGWGGKPEMHTVSIYFDFSPAAPATRAAAPAPAAAVSTWNDASPDQLRSVLMDSGRLLAAMLKRIYVHGDAGKHEPYVIGTTFSREKLRGYLEGNIDDWAVLRDDNGDYFVFKPLRLFPVKPAA